MKLRTSFFNPAAFKKDVTRFAPAWVLYTVGLFMVLSVCLIDNSEFYQASALATTLGFMAFINFSYGLLNGQLLFGDLFNARHCNALHAIHLRRECWFVTHITAGLLFSLVPNLVVSLVAMTMLGTGWQVALWWLLASGLQYLFFFGLSVFSALCVGSRFAMVLIYSIINFFSLIVYWFCCSIYEPLLYGVRISSDAFLDFCPAFMMMSNFDLVEVQFHGNGYASAVHAVTLGDGWSYLSICAVIGVVLLGASLFLYRRRKLESAGDFMAVRILEPVFQILYTMCVAAFFHAFADLFGLNGYIFLALGLAIGFFTGRMFLKRTIRVFQPKAFLALGILGVVFAASMFLTQLDPMGITRYVPNTSAVKEVHISTSYDPDFVNTPAMTDEADIQAICQLHQQILDGWICEDGDTQIEDHSYHTYLNIYYVLQNGSTVSRTYEVAASSPAALAAETFFSRPEYVLGNDVQTTVETAEYFSFYDYTGENYVDLSMYPDLVEGLLLAIEADCEEGSMAQNWFYHQNDDSLGYIEFDYLTPSGIYNYTSIEIYTSATHTIAYLEEYIYPLFG